MNVPFETNVSVPKGDYDNGIVTQFFFRDPDGYYIELCNCDILTKFCLDKSEKIYLEGYEEGVSNTQMLHPITKLLLRAWHAKENIENEDFDKIIHEFDQLDSSDTKVDESKLANLVKRLKVYGDVVQGETEESLREFLKKAKNDVPMVIRYIKAKHGNNQLFQPPTIYKNNEEAYTPPVLHIENK